MIEFGVQPDMITCAKGLTSGYLPLGALIFSDRIWAAMAADGGSAGSPPVSPIPAIRSPAPPA
ncbi:MAG: hypothetical protein U5N10_11020 [Gemmobacter sp.]|nr:hypothetical protein [Gemmobacter sp.]